MRGSIRMLAINLCILLFADDVALVSDSLNGMCDYFDAFHKFCNVYDMRVSEAKTKVLANRKGLR